MEGSSASLQMEQSPEMGLRRRCRRFLKTVDVAQRRSSWTPKARWMLLGWIWMSRPRLVKDKRSGLYV